MDKYIFFDRDGVVNRDGWGITEHGYIKTHEELVMMPKAIEAFKAATEAGYKNIIISNQKGVGKGYFTQDALELVTDEIKKRVSSGGGSIDGVFYCIHANENECSCCKPKPGLFFEAQKAFGIDKLDDRFYYMGDTERDIAAGKAAGLKTILVYSGKTSPGDESGWEVQPDHVLQDILEAVNYIIGREKV